MSKISCRLSSLLLLLMLINLIGCKHKSSPLASTLTVKQLDSIRHQQVADSLASLDRFIVLGNLHLGMTKEEYDSLMPCCSKGAKFGKLQFETLDTIMYHDSVNLIKLTASYSQREFEYSEAIDQLKSLMETFHEVVNTLSAKYGRPTSLMTSKDKLGYGSSWWDFGFFKITYDQTNRITSARQHEVSAEGVITYSVPNIPTKEEKAYTDSIINIYHKEQGSIKQRNDNLKQAL